MENIFSTSGKNPPPFPWTGPLIPALIGHVVEKSAPKIPPSLLATCRKFDSEIARLQGKVDELSVEAVVGEFRRRIDNHTEGILSGTVLLDALDEINVESVEVEYSSKRAALDEAVRTLCGRARPSVIEVHEVLRKSVEQLAEKLDEPTRSLSAEFMVPHEASAAVRVVQSVAQYLGRSAPGEYLSTQGHSTPLAHLRLILPSYTRGN